MQARHVLARSNYRGEPVHLYYKPTRPFIQDAEWLVRRCKAAGIHIVPHPGTCAADGPLPTLQMNAEVFGTDLAVSFVQMLAQDGSLLRQTLAVTWAENLAQFRDLLYAASGPAERDRVAAAFEQWLAEDCKLLCNYHVRKQVSAPLTLQGFQTGDFGLPDLQRLWIRPPVYH